MDGGDRGVRGRRGGHREMKGWRRRGGNRGVKRWRGKYRGMEEEGGDIGM